jgi:threonine aldolase
MLLSLSIINSLIFICSSVTISSKDSLPSFDLVQKYISGLTKKLPMLAESPSALIEQDFYSSMKAHQEYVAQQKKQFSFLIYV